MSSRSDPNDNWDMAILTAVLLVLLFFWFYKFLFVTNPADLPSPINQLIASTDFEIK